MKNSEIIHILKDPIKSTIEKFSRDEIPINFTSRTIATCLYLYRNKKITDADIRDKNNPLGLINPSTGQTQEFVSFEDCLLHYKESYLTEEKYDEDLEKEYDAICKANNLYRLDKDYIESSNGNVIDLTEEQKTSDIDVYTVKKDSKEITRTTNLQEANRVASINNATVYNSRNKAINGKITRETKKHKVAVSTSILRAGSLIECEGLNLYKKAADKAPIRSITGMYYLFDGREYKGKYAVCLRADLANTTPSTIVGWVRASDIR